MVEINNKDAEKGKCPDKPAGASAHNIEFVRYDEVKDENENVIAVLGVDSDGLYHPISGTSYDKNNVFPKKGDTYFNVSKGGLKTNYMFNGHCWDNVGTERRAHIPWYQRFWDWVFFGIKWEKL